MKLAVVILLACRAFGQLNQGAPLTDAERASILGAEVVRLQEHLVQLLKREVVSAEREERTLAAIGGLLGHIRRLESRVNSLERYVDENEKRKAEVLRKWKALETKAKEPAR